MPTTAVPKVSVIIATFNWSAALWCALRSVQGQKFENFEVLVVGDCCTDDSEEVVKSFEDSRFYWFNLSANHGSQWAPNNFGIENSRGDWIAYLGHDDIWHPDHLSSLLIALEARVADGAVATMLMYGPPGSGIIHAAGAVPTEYLQFHDFVPPSGLIHSRSVVNRLGSWKDAHTIAMPTDCEFLSRIIRHGAIIPSGVLTVFKFNAATRRDSYLRKSVIEQEAMLHSIEFEPDFRHRQLVEALKSFAAGKLLTVRLPASFEEPPGAIARSNRRFKGVEERFTSDQMVSVEKLTRFGLEGPVGGFEWHDLELSAAYGSFRWSGPATVSVIDLPVICNQQLDLKIRILFSIDPVLIDDLVLSVNEIHVEYRILHLSDGTVDVLTSAPTSTRHLRISFEVPRTVRPASSGPSADGRWLGVAVAWIEVSPISSRQAPSSSCQAR